MARIPRTSTSARITDTRHLDTRPNNPPAALAGEAPVPLSPKVTYEFSPHRTPQLQFDPDARLEVLLEKSAREPLAAEEVAEMRTLYASHEPWLEWAGKREKPRASVDPVALHIHERVSSQAILEVARRQSAQKSLFAGTESWDWQKQTAFYQHEMDWANRLILGDSLQVMASLAARESLAGRVQMVYLDPPYGIKFASNFQPKIGQRDVKDKDSDLSREPETVRAYRDTWQLGIHSYLSYLRDRLYSIKALLHDSGSVFVQISDENLHRVRALMDEVFGPENFVSLIVFRTSGGLGRKGIKTIFDVLLWYAKDANTMKFRPLFSTKETGEGTMFKYAEKENGERVPLEAEELEAEDVIRFSDLVSSGLTPSCVYNFEFDSRTFAPGRNCSWKTNSQGMMRLAQANRLAAPASTLQFVYHHSDFPVSTITNMWDDTVGELKKSYVVQTSNEVIKRCMLMTTDPGDLVLDPTCGSGTTAVVAEQWGRRWITCDTSRVAVAIARQRLLTARFDQFRLLDESRGVKGGFKCRTVPHVTLKSIAQNPHLDPIFARFEPQLDEALQSANEALQVLEPDIRRALKDKLARKEKDSKKSVSDADRRRWKLPVGPAIEIAAEGRVAPTVHLSGQEPSDGVRVGGQLAAGPPAAISIAGPTGNTNKTGFQHWTIPFDTDELYPQVLADAITRYRAAWRAKMDAVNSCIADNAESETLVDQPERVPNVVRVCGPFTVESVQPPEMSLGEASVPLFEPQFEGEPGEMPAWQVREVHATPAMETQNIEAYLDNMVRLLEGDGVLFPDNRAVKFERLERVSFGTSPIHAEGEWLAQTRDGSTSELRRVGVSFGPQYGPITRKQVLDAISSAVHYRDFVFAGFSFDAEATETIETAQHPRLRLHMAQIRPDVNPGMEGLLKDTPGSQLFTVFGAPRVALSEQDGQFQITMEGVDIYDPVSNEIVPTRQDKVAAWFLDTDYDGRVFCITQAFFPDKSAWEKIERALKSTLDADAFAHFSGTVSLPFERGENGRAAVKVIDPRGNEVMKVVALNS